MQISDNGLPRRCRTDLMTAAELAIRQAQLAVEDAGAHPLLTEASELLVSARQRVADFAELPQAQK
jgi:hypothetical protein